MTTPQLVDVAILRAVYDAAKVRLKLVREQEREEYGAPFTTMAEVGRSTLHKWKPPRKSTPPTQVNRSDKSKLRAFRFHMPRETHQQVKERIHSAGCSVAGVIQDGLEHFARSGEY